MTNIDTILKKFDEEFIYLRQIFHDGLHGEESEKEEMSALKSFISSSLTELLQGLIQEIEGEKKYYTHSKGNHSDDFNDTEPCDCDRQEQEIRNSALNLAQERIRAKLK